MSEDTTKALTFQQYMGSDSIQRRLLEVFGKEASFYAASIIANYNNNKGLKECDYGSIVSAAVQAALLKLPLSTQLGYAYIVPYNVKVGNAWRKYAQLQIGWKGFVQLAIRSRQYETINAGVVYEGQLQNFNHITGEFELSDPEGDKVVGYFAYFKLTNGFQKMLYMSAEKMSEHAEKYSQSYQYDLKGGKKTSVWSTNFDAMGTKTVLKLLIQKYGIVSIEMREALSADQAMVRKDKFVYVDNGNNTAYRDAEITMSQMSEEADDDIPFDTVDAETGEVMEE